MLHRPAWCLAGGCGVAEMQEIQRNRDRDQQQQPAARCFGHAGRDREAVAMRAFGELAQARGNDCGDHMRDRVAAQRRRARDYPRECGVAKPLTVLWPVIHPLTLCSSAVELASAGGTPSGCSPAPPRGSAGCWNTLCITKSAV